MTKCFNVEGVCNPTEHYMVNLDNRLEEIKALVDRKKYFSINRGRQYGKTTTLKLLARKLKEEYVVFLISFEGLTDEEYESQSRFCRAFAGLLSDAIEYGGIEGISETARGHLVNMSLPDSPNVTIRQLSNLISQICKTAERPVVLMIDEADQAGNHKLFMDFLGMLRKLYLDRDVRDTFWSVILAGVYDIRNMKLKLRSEEEHQKNSPWNIAADFNVEMGLDVQGIAGMLFDYEQDHHTGMDIGLISELLCDYTSGYPFLVSRLCKIMDEELAADPEFADRSDVWTKKGFLAAVKILLLEKNTLFESLVNKLSDYPELRDMIYKMLFSGETVTFNIFNPAIDIASMFGFVKNADGRLCIANRIFEMLLYNLFTSEEEVNNSIFSAGAMEKSQFIQNGILDMELVMKKFMLHWNELYSSSDEKFIEENGRKFFLLYLKPIINGTGNYYIEAQTRDRKRTDLIVDYCGRQYIIEIKIWHGDEYNRRGEEQLAGYLDGYHASKGYLLSFNFNKKKVIGARQITCNNKTIFEVVV